MAYLHDLGPLAIASRMKSVTDLLIRDMIMVYRGQNIDFEPRWFTFIHLISRKGPTQITLIARELNQSHPAINQVANALEKKGYIRSMRDAKDNRKRIIELTEQGRALLSRLEPVWDAVERSVTDLLNSTSPDFLDNVDKIEEELIRKPMEKRISALLTLSSPESVEVIDYQPELSEHFKSLNETWLNAYFSVEQEDYRLLENPQKEIVDKGGNIIFARIGNKVVGTAALLHTNENTCELTKMAVAPAYQGKKAGRCLLDALIASAKKKKYKKMVLLTSEKLEKAVSLYRSAGFVESDSRSMLKHNYRRCSVQMELKLSTNK
jgi:DNA-binding MarR family transcriptional regulator/N-acetylglutamate synthase-like GNAT family acetyltransferase